MLGLSRVARTLRKPFPSSAKKAADDVADDGVTAAGEVGRQTTRPIATALGVAGVGGAGAYAYGEQQETKQENQRSERYQKYQNRIAAIEREYERGNISKAEMEARKQEAWEAYRRSMGDDTAGMTLSQFIMNLGTGQLIALSILASVSVYVIVPRLFSALEGTPGPADILG